ncbi:MAG: formate--tetrahydrofolate ligase [Acetanaerobacterium sp.]
MCEACEKPSDFHPLYDETMPMKDKIACVAKTIYGAKGVVYSAGAERSIRDIEALGKGHLRVCIAKTQYSLSDDPKLLCRPRDFEITVRDVRLSAGAGFIVVVTGDIMTMPGLPKNPAACSIDVDDNGCITGLF